MGAHFGQTEKPHERSLVVDTIFAVLHILSFSAWLGVLFFFRLVLVPASRELPFETRIAAIGQARRRLDLVVAVAIPVVFASGLIVLALHWDATETGRGLGYPALIVTKLVLASFMAVVHGVQRFTYGAELDKIEPVPGEPHGLERSRWLRLLEVNSVLGGVVLGLGLLL